jgi:hypothetical protein
MALSNAERQRVWRERHKGEPRGTKALLAQCAALQARVVQLEAELAARPPPLQGLRMKPRMFSSHVGCDLINRNEPHSLLL